MKALGVIILLVVLAVLATCISHARKPELLAHVNVARTSLIITNGNDRAWRQATVILNDAFDGPRATITTVEAGARIEIPLTDFVGLFNKQRFNPEFQKVEQVLIDVDGFQIGTFRTRAR